MKFRDITPLNIRFPTELRNKLKAVAEAKTAGSMNAEVIERVAASFEERRELKDVADGDLIQELIDRYGRDSIFILIAPKKDGGNAIREIVQALNEKLSNEPHEKDPG